MKLHRSLTPRALLARPRHELARMIASEFLRAAQRSHVPANVTSAFQRARELMGVLETAALPIDVARRLKAMYDVCSSHRLLQRELADPQRIRSVANEIADEFETAAQQLIVAV